MVLLGLHKEVSDINWEHGDNVNKYTYVILVDSKGICLRIKVIRRYVAVKCVYVSENWATPNWGYSLCFMITRKVSPFSIYYILVKNFEKKNVAVATIAL